MAVNTVQYKYASESLLESILLSRVTIYILGIFFDNYFCYPNLRIFVRLMYVITHRYKHIVGEMFVNNLVSPNEMCDSGILRIFIREKKIFCVLNNYFYMINVHTSIVISAKSTTPNLNS